MRAAHDAFIDAGASIILSSSYQTSPETDAASVAASVKLALCARDEAAEASVEAWVSVGPYGATLADGSEYRGDYAVGEAALCEWHASRLALFLSVDHPRPPDGLAFETIPCMDEVAAILGLLCEERAREIPAWVSFSCRDGHHLADGTKLADAVEACCEAFARRLAPSFVGVNCVPPSIVSEALDEILRTAAARGGGGALTGVVLYPNGGGTWDPIGRCWRVSEEGSFVDTSAAAWADQIRAAGLEAIIGGCCSTDQCTIRSLRRALAP